jgi:hypothetical protein
MIEFCLHGIQEETKSADFIVAVRIDRMDDKLDNRSTGCVHDDLRPSLVTLLERFGSASGGNVWFLPQYRFSAARIPDIARLDL